MKSRAARITRLFLAPSLPYLLAALLMLAAVGVGLGVAAVVPEWALPEPCDLFACSEGRPR